MTEHKPLTDKDLDAIKARCDAATEGPWFTRASYGASNRRFLIIESSPDTGNVGTAFEDKSKDATFIAHARTDLPRLVAEVRRLREEALKGRPTAINGLCSMCQGTGIAQQGHYEARCLCCREVPND